MRTALAALLTATAALFLPAVAGGEDATVGCSHWHADPAPGYSGPLPRGISCQHAMAPMVTWTVPAGIATARFSVSGGDQPGAGRGGRVDATLAVIPGTTYTLEMGAAGTASAVSVDGLPLIVAGGGDGDVPNYVAPTASEVQLEQPGAPLPPFPQEGRIYVEWDVHFEGPGDSPAKEPQFTPPPNEPRCLVPHLEALRPVAARRALARNHCALGRVTRRPAKRSRLGRVIRQFPAPGARLEPGAAVDVVVGRRR